ncbi:MAG TPA: HAD-IC family P-type ATPase, partial [Blastocatellia bacterium]|nr:HAD-IC family P-type ATPase [Blastocatellia bacterium]
SGTSIRLLLQTAATAERSSEHPLGRAILKKLAEEEIAAVDPDRFYYIPGRGVVCIANGDQILVGNRGLLEEWNIDLGSKTSAVQGGAQSGCYSEILVARRNCFLGAIQIADVPRREALEAISEIKRMGIKTILLTGDAEPVAREVAANLGIDEFMAGMLPDQKRVRIKTLRYTGAKIAMVGDGINDAPALMDADVGLAMGSGADIAQESASVVLIGNDLLKLVDLLKVARRCRKIIMFNFAGTLLVDAVGVGLAAFGLLNPLLAAFIHVSSEMAFILNSARLLPVRAPRRGTGRAADHAPDHAPVHAMVE